MMKAGNLFGMNVKYDTHMPKLCTLTGPVVEEAQIDAQMLIIDSLHSHREARHGFAPPSGSAKPNPVVYTSTKGNMQSQTRPMWQGSLVHLYVLLSLGTTESVRQKAHQQVCSSPVPNASPMHIILTQAAGLARTQLLMQGASKR